MAEKEEYPFGTPQEHALICEKHSSMPIDFICEDCEDFICTKCVKEDHKDHEWDTITTAATLKSRGLLKTLSKIEEEDIQQMDENIEKVSKQMKKNKKRCKTEASRIKRQYDAIVEKLEKIRKQQKRELSDRLRRKHADLSQVRSSLEEKKKKVLQSVKSLKENSSNMTDISLLKTNRELTKLLSTKNIDIPMFDFLSKYECGNINEETLQSMMGQIIQFDYENIAVAETNSLQWGNEPIELLKAIDEDTCLLSADLVNVIQLNKHQAEKEKQFKVIAGLRDICVTDNTEIYITCWMNKSISCLFPSGLISTRFSTDPLLPKGICQTKDGGLFVTLEDTETERYEPNPHSRRLVRHVTLTGDVIHEYEFQGDSQTRLFTSPYIVKQNGNTDICVTNWTSKTTGDLVILFYAGSLKSVYSGHKQKKEFAPTDLANDRHCNIIVSDKNNSTIHLLSPEGKFIKYLLTENQVVQPVAISLKNSTLWIGDDYGVIKVFQYTL